MLAINPRGQLPAFRDGDVVVNESLAAIMYLEDKYDSGTRLLPGDSVARARVSQQSGGLVPELQNTSPPGPGW